VTPKASRSRSFLLRPARSLLTSLLALGLLSSSTGCGGAMSSAEARPSVDVASTPTDDKATGGFFGGEMTPAREELAGSPNAKMAPPEPGMPPQQQPSGPAARAGAGAERPDAVIIYSAELTLAVFEVQKSIEEVASIAKRQGGFLARRDDNSITVRIPSTHFDQTVKDLEAVGDVLHRNVTAEDVSEEFHDLQIQLRNLMAMRERLVALLAKSTKVEEAIAVEKELGRVAGEIDRIQGRMKFLEDRARMSTITVRLQPRAPSGVEKGPFQVPLPWLHDLGIDRLIRL
jgi:hypothetical protein